MWILKNKIFWCLLLVVTESSAQSVSHLIEASLLVHPAIKSAHSGAKEAQTGMRIAEKQFWPTPSVMLEQVNPSSADPAYGGSGVSQIYRLQQPLWTWGRLDAGVDKAQLQGHAAEVHLLDVRQQVALDTLQAWVDWTAATEKIAVVERSLAKYTALRDLVERRIEAGASAPAERSTTQARWGQASVQLTVFRTAQAMAKVRVLQLSGLEIKVVPLVLDQVTLPKSPALQEVLDFSPVLKKAQLQIELAQADVRARRAQGLPEVYARAEHQRYPAGQSASRVFLGVQSNFGAGLSHQDEVAALQQRITGLREDAQARQIEVTQQYEAMALSLAQASESLPVLRANVDTNMESLASMERQFLTGRRSWIDVLNAVRESMQSELELVDSQLSIVRAQWRLNLMAMPVEAITRTFVTAGS